MNNSFIDIISIFIEFKPRLLVCLSFLFSSNRSILRRLNYTMFWSTYRTRNCYINQISRWPRNDRIKNADVRTIFFYFTDWVKEANSPRSSRFVNKPAYLIIFSNSITQRSCLSIRVLPSLQPQAKWCPKKVLRIANTQLYFQQKRARDLKPAEKYGKGGFDLDEFNAWIDLYELCGLKFY